MTSGHYGYWCVTCNAPIKDGEQVIDVPHGVAHAACHCSDQCPACDVPMHAGYCTRCGFDPIEAYEERRRRRLAERNEY